MGLTLIVIRSLLWLERLALEASGKHLPNDYIAYDNADIEQTNPLVDDGSDESSARCTSRWFRNSVAIVVAVPLIGAYAILHICWSDESEVFWSAWIYEWIMIPILISIFFGAPLHAALGYFHPHSTTQQCHERLTLLVQDSTTQSLVQILAVVVVVYVACDSLFFIPLLDMKIELLIPFYLAAVVLNISFIYSGLFLSLLSFRAINIRLQQVHTEVVQAVHSVPHNTDSTTIYSSLSLNTNPHDHSTGTAATASSSPPDNDDQRQQYYQTSAGGWLEEYQALWHDMHEISVLAGPRIIVGIGMFVVETSNMVLTMWKETEKDFARSRFFFLMLAMYLSNCTVLVSTIFQAAYPQTLCEHYIASQMAILNMSLRRRADPSCSYLGELSETFRRNPIRLHVGNFEMSIEMSTAVTFLFASLFLLVVLGWEGVEA